VSAKAIVLFAHGARDPRWAAPFEAIAARVQVAVPARVVRLAFLELMAPSLSEAVAGLVGEGVHDVDVIPLFLGTGGHLRQDLPRQAEAARAAHPGLRLRVHAPIGEDAAVMEAIARAAIRLSGE
jgi:sirohydrochlorin cobaltochelatase